MAWLVQQIFPGNKPSILSTLIEGLAWPVAVIVIAAMFRREVRLVLERIVKLKYHDFEAQFRRDLLQSEELATRSKLPRPGVIAHVKHCRIIHQLDRQEESHEQNELTHTPRIVRSWSVLNEDITRAAGPAHSTDSIQALLEQNRLFGATLQLFERLKGLYDQILANPGFSPSIEEAQRFENLTRQLSAWLLEGDSSKGKG